MQASSGNPVWRWGLIFGAIYAAVSILGTVLQYTVGGGSTPGAFSGGSLGLSCLFFIIELAILLVAGLMAARQTGMVRTGTFAGMVAGGVGGVVGAIVGIIVLVTRPASYWQQIASSSSGQLTAQQLQSAAIIGGIVGIIIGFAIAIGIGAGLGALGGLIGKNQYRGPVAGYQPSMYQGMGQTPGYPPPPGYPQQPQGYPPQYPQQQPEQPQYPQNPGAYPPPPPPPQYPPQQ